LTVCEEYTGDFTVKIVRIMECIKFSGYSQVLNDFRFLTDHKDKHKLKLHMTA